MGCAAALSVLGQVAWRGFLHEAEAHHVGCRSQEDQLGSESAMGKGERSRAETQAHNLSGRQKENRGGTAGTVGEGEGWEEVEASGACHEYG